ncbi:hypothetical protein K1719_016769 [Acacia pycnantha]|nr:hypothetical protein K1719_016769 [Acacia pycnantha]
MKPQKVNIAPVIGSPNTFQIVGSSNGVLCVSVYRYPEFFLSFYCGIQLLERIQYDYAFPFEVRFVVVYSLSSGSWKKVEFGIKNVGLDEESVTVNGIMFWSGFEKNPDTDTCYFAIVSFDIANEVFTLIPAPTPDWSTSTTSRLTMYHV